MIRYLWLALLASAVFSSSAWAELNQPIGFAPGFTNATGSPLLDNYTKIIPRLIFTKLANSQRLSLVERSELVRLLDEMGLGEMGIVDPETAAKVGRAVGARFMFIGELSEFRGKAGLGCCIIGGNASTGKPETRIRITTRLVKVESAEVIGGWQISALPTELGEQANNLADKILKSLFPVSTWGAAGRSLLIPGWGQFANDRGSGYAFLPLAIAGLGGLAVAQYAYMQANDDYEEILGRERKTYAEMQKAEDKRDSRKTLRLISAGAVAGIWLVNTADASWKARILNKRRQHAESRVKLEARVEPQSVQIVWAARF